MHLSRFVRALLASAGFCAAASGAQAAGPVVLELFTSQSCSSCPAADALLKTLVQNDGSLLALSYHVDYWDHLSWKDTYSSPANTARQRAYADMLGGGAFTPELVVGGTSYAVGSDRAAVGQAIDKARNAASPVTIAISPAGSGLNVAVSASGPAPSGAELLEVRFDRYAKTEVKAGENGGRTLEAINNVTGIKSLGTWSADKTSYTLDSPLSDGVAILLQSPEQGPILAAASYIKP